MPTTPAAPVPAPSAKPSLSTRIKSEIVLVLGTAAAVCEALSTLLLSPGVPRDIVDAVIPFLAAAGARPNVVPLVKLAVQDAPQALSAASTILNAIRGKKS